MIHRKPNQNEQALLELLGCEQSEVKRHSTTVYEWRGVYFEVLTVEQMKHGKVPASWYTPIGNNFRIREMGKQAEKVKRIKNKKEVV